MRKAVGKKCTHDNPKGNMGYDQYTVPNDCSCRTSFCCFPLVLDQTYVHGLQCDSFKFLWRTVLSKPPSMPFGIVMCPFSDKLSQNSCMHLHFIFATWNSHISWLNMLDTMLLILKLCNWIWKNTKFLDGIRDLAPTLLESKGWRTGESACLPPMWSRFLVSMPYVSWGCCWFSSFL